MTIPVEDRIREVLAAADPALLQSFRLKWNSYIPHDPTPKQHAFLMLPHREALYGGAAGGGKSDALLMGALQHIDRRSYSAIIFRKTIADLKKRGALIDRSFEWLSGTDAKWSASTYTWIFPSGATVAFGYLADASAKYSHQSAHYHYIAFDELSQFYQEDYLYLFSRNRRNLCQKHMKASKLNNNNPPGYDPRCKACVEFSDSADIPLRMRGATNPGGLGHVWLKKRFQMTKVKLPDGTFTFVGGNPKRPFISANITDNPYLDEDEYEASLQELDPITRDQLLKGDWDAAHSGRFKREWIDIPNGKPRRWSERGDYWILGPDGNGESILKSDCSIIAILDPAASAREGPGDELLYQNRDPSWSVIGIFAITPNWHLLWIDNIRYQKEVPDTIEEVKQAYRRWRPEFVGCENTGLGIGVYQCLVQAGLPIIPLHPGSSDKLVRATPACNRMKQGRIWLPQTAPWLDALEEELFYWTGHPHQQDDQVDVLAYACQYVSEIAADTEIILPTGQIAEHHQTMPGIYNPWSNL